MSATQELLEAVRVRAQGTPYVVEPTAQGFDVRLALEDPRWFGTFRTWQLTQALVHHVRTDEGRRTCSVDDELRALAWRAGTDGRERPVLEASRSFARGNLGVRRVERTYSIGRGGLTKESETSFDTGAGRDLVTATARSLGWTVHRSLSERIGLVVGLGSIALLVLAGVVVGILALAGHLS